MHNESLSKQLTKWKKQKAALVASKRFDDVGSLAEIATRGQLLVEFVDMIDTVGKGNDLDTCARFRASVEKIVHGVGVSRRR